MRMGKPTEITIDEVKYIRADSVVRPSGRIKIAILERGFVYIGHIQSAPNDPWIVMRNTKNIRRWGTTKGLGELVDGPLSGTKLDQVGTIRVPLHALISLIEVNQSGWAYISK